VQTGGNSVLVNHHYGLRQQRYAIDLAMPYSRGDGTTRDAVEDFPSFGAPVLAPGDGRVVRVDDSRPDQPIGSMDASHPLGNFVVVQLANDRYVLLAHLKAGSILVRQGDRVRAGATVAAVGNSGNSSEPHLHLQVQSGPDLMNESGTGWADITTTPFSFRSDQGGTAAHKVPRMGDRLVFEAVAP
jgi:murein DD-endopeptidase MepM/ murein hydrolase activator NlpD